MSEQSDHAIRQLDLKRVPAALLVSRRGLAGSFCLVKREAPVRREALDSTSSVSLILASSRRRSDSSAGGRGWTVFRKISVRPRRGGSRSVPPNKLQGEAVH